MGVDPAVSKEFPILILFMVFVLTISGSFMAFLKWLYERFEKFIESQNKRQGDQSEYWRTAIGEIFEEQNRLNQDVLSRLDDMTNVLRVVITRFDEHDRRTMQKTGVMAPRKVRR